MLAIASRMLLGARSRNYHHRTCAFLPCGVANQLAAARRAAQEKTCPGCSISRHVWAEHMVSIRTQCVCVCASTVVAVSCGKTHRAQCAQDQQPAG